MNKISHVEINTQGQNIEQRPKMSEVCKGFHITSQKVASFYHYAKNIKEEEINNHYKTLPCYSAGIAYLGNEKFQWIIRSGGVGEFYNEKASFTKVCGVSCCDKVQGVC
jgi:hypothetical protein